MGERVRGLARAACAACNGAGAEGRRLAQAATRKYVPKIKEVIAFYEGDLRGLIEAGDWEGVAKAVTAGGQRPPSEAPRIQACVAALNRAGRARSNVCGPRRRRGV